MLMRNLVFIIIAVFFCLIQSTVIKFISIGSAVPNIILILICYVALFHGRRAMWYGFGTGLFVDLYSIKGFGYNTLVNTIIGWLLGFIGQYLYKKQLLSQVVTLFVTSCIHDLIIAIPGADLSFYTFYSKILPSSLYTTFIGVILFYLFQKIDLRGG